MHWSLTSMTFLDSMLFVRLTKVRLLPRISEQLRHEISLLMYLITRNIFDNEQSSKVFQRALWSNYSGMGWQNYSFWNTFCSRTFFVPFGIVAHDSTPRTKKNNKTKGCFYDLRAYTLCQNTKLYKYLVILSMSLFQPKL